MRLLWNYLKNYKKILFGALILATINQTFSLLDPLVFRFLIDNYLTKIGEIAKPDFIRGVILLSLAAIGVALVSRLAKNFQDYFVNVIAQRLGAKMYSDSVGHSFSLPYVVFEDQRSGEFLQKLQKARTDAQVLITSLVNSVFFSLVGVIFVLIYASTVHWLIGLGYFLAIPILAAATFAISRRIKTAQERIIRETASLAGSTTETLRNVELVKSLGLENQEIKRLNNTNQAILDLELNKVKTVRTLSFIQGTIVNTLRASLMLLMYYLMFMGDLSLGQFFSLLFYSFFIFNPLSELGTVAQQYQEARASMDRLEQILDTPPEPKPEHPKQLDGLKEIDFKNVDFKYETGDKPALTGVDVAIKAGQTVAFVGPSGSGKTTLVKLLVGLYKPTQGSVQYNGISVNEVDLEKLRARIGLVAQDTQLFAGTIRENLLFAQPNATDEECMEALRSAAANNILDRGNAGLDTKIGEGGLKLSGGEKQRLAIARALLRKPDLIIFDEATSSLDSITEEQITQTIRDIERNRKDLINVLVAHRLSTILHADTIYVLEKGKIVEQGSHDQLLKQQGLYNALWRQQVASKETFAIPAKAGI